MIESKFETLQVHCFFGWTFELWQLIAWEYETKTMLDVRTEFDRTGMHFQARLLAHNMEKFMF